MSVDLPLRQSAFKHGVSRNNILHACRNVIEVRQHPKDGLVYIGPAADGTLLEIGLVKIEGEWTIVHAMRARKGYLMKHA